MITDTIGRLNMLISLKPANDKDILKIESELSLRLANEYKDYLKEYGAIIADGIELTGFSKSKHRDVIEVTKREWELNNKIPHNNYVIECLGIEGLIIWQNEEGLIFESSPNQELKQINNSLEEYIKSKII